MVPLGVSTISSRIGYGSAASSTTSAAKKNSKTPYGDMLGEIMTEQQRYYDSAYRPVAQGLIKDTESTAIVDAATKQAGSTNVADIKARRDRQKARLGVSTTGSSAVLGDYQSSLAKTTQTDGAINEARLQQDERNSALVNDLVGISRGIASDSISGMQDATSAEANRNSTNANIKAQNTAARNSLLGSAASLALLLAI